MTPQHPARRRSTGRAVGAASLAFAALAATTLVGTTPAQAADGPLIESGSTAWQYLEDGSDPAAGAADRTAWTTGTLPAGDWKTGSGSFGAKNGAASGMGGGLTVDTLLDQYLDDGKDVPTYFFRTSFDVTSEDLAGWKSLVGDVTYDDGLVVYVNGTRVAGFEDAEVTQNVQYAGEGGGDPDRSTFPVDASLLHAGENTVAVALYQDRATSSDIYFDMQSLTPVDADTPAHISDVVMNIGADDASRNLAWYTDSGAEQVAQLVPAASLADGAFPEAGATVVPSTTGQATDGQQYHHATLSGLAPATEYAYRVGSDADGWSAVTRFTTGAADGAYGFTFIGDAQIGASGDEARDAAGWAETLDVASREFPDTEMVFSAGDQVNTASSETQYAGFLAPAQLRSTPLVTNIGNHDVASLAYEQHFNLPNVSAEHGKPDAARAGGDYWFTYDDTLYISFNSNDKDDAGHAAFAREVLAEHGDEARWKVVTFHHSVYSVASHSTDSDIITRRAQLPPALSALDVDLVLMGHDHVYVRSYLMSGTTPVDTDAPVSDTVTPEGDEVLYVTANSSSGSKYYDIKDIDFDFDAVQNQEYTPNFTNVEVTADSIAMTTYRTKDMTVVDRVTLAKPAEEPGTEEPGTEEPGTEEPGTEQPGTEQPGTEQPGTEEPGTEEPGTEEPGTEQPSEDAPVPADLDSLTEATHTLRVDAVDTEAGTVTVTVPREFAGTPFDWFVHSDAEYLGDDPSDDDGVLTLRLPADLEAGTHTLVAQRADGSVATWGEFVFDPATADGADTPGGELAFTGAEVLPLAAGSALALLAGLGIALVARRRRA